MIDQKFELHTLARIETRSWERCIFICGSVSVISLGQRYNKGCADKIFLCIPFFLKHVEKCPYFYPNFSRLIISQSRSKGWEPQSVVPNQDRKVGNHNLWFPIKVKGLGTTTCGFRAKLKGWEPQSVVPNL